MQAGEVTARLTADITDLQRKLQAAAQLMTNFRRQVEGGTRLQVDTRGLDTLKRQAASLTRDPAATLARDQARAERDALTSFRRTMGERVRLWEREQQAAAKAQKAARFDTPESRLRGSVLGRVQRALQPRLQLPLATGAAPAIAQMASAFRAGERASGGFQARLKGLQAELRSMNTLLKGVSLTAMATAAVLAGVRFGRSIIGAGVEMERLNNRLRTAAGSAEQAGQDLEFLRAHAERLGLDLLVASNGYADLIASARHAHVPLAQARELFIGLSEAITAMQLSNEEAAGVFLAFRQIISQGGLQGQEINQLAERIPGALGLITQALGLTGAQLKKALRDGIQIPLETFLPRMNAVLAQFHADATRGAQSYTAATNRLNNAWRDLLNTLASSGVLDTVTRLIERLAQAVNSLAQNPNVARSGRLLAATATGTAGMLADLTGNVGIELRTPTEQSQAALTSTITQIRRDSARAQGSLQALQRQLDATLQAGGVWAARRAADLRTKLAPLEQAQLQRQEQLAALEGVQAQLTPKTGDAAKAPVTFPPIDLPAPKGTRDAAADALKRFQGELRSLKAMVTLGLMPPLEALEEQAQLVKRRIAEILEQPPTDKTRAEVKALTDEFRTMEREIGRQKNLQAIGEQAQQFAADLAGVRDALSLTLEAATTPEARTAARLNALQDELREVEGLITRLRGLSLTDPQAMDAMLQQLDAAKQRYLDLRREIEAATQAETRRQAVSDLREQLGMLQLEAALTGKSRREKEKQLLIEERLAQLRAQKAPADPETRAQIEDLAERTVAAREALRELRDPLQEFLDAAEPTWVQFRQGALDAISHIEDALIDMWETGEIRAGDMLKAIQRDLMRALTRELITTPLVEGMQEVLDIAQGLKDATGGVSGWLGSLLGKGAEALGIARTTPQAAEQARAEATAAAWARLDTAITLAAADLAGFTVAVEAVTAALQALAGQATVPTPGDATAALPSAVPTDIPAMAAGGIVTKPTLALLGEQGPEAVVPLQYGGVVAMGAMMGMSELLNLFFKPGKAKELPFKDLGGPEVIGPGSLDALAHGTDPLTGVDPAASIQWSSEAEREDYLRPDAANLWQQLLRWLMTMGAMIGGSKLGNALGSSGSGPVAMAGSGAEGPIAMAQHGLMAKMPTLALIGEAGSEAVIPLKDGAVPTKITPRGLLEAFMPSGDHVPIQLPQMAEGGLVGNPVAASAMPRSTTGTVWRDGQPVGSASGWTINNHFTIQTPDANSFKASQSQIVASYSLALERARKRHT